MTLFTVGYGDYVPHTHGGRLIAVLCGMGGLVLVAVMIASVGTFMRLTRSEAKVDERRAPPPPTPPLATHARLRTCARPRLAALGVGCGRFRECGWPLVPAGLRTAVGAGWLGAGVGEGAGCGQLRSEFVQCLE
jgi:hypothetical protein